MMLAFICDNIILLLLYIYIVSYSDPCKHELHTVMPESFHKCRHLI